MLFRILSFAILDSRRLQQKMQSFEKVSDGLLQDLKQLLLQKDATNEAAATAILAKLGSDVTLKMFSYLATLYHPDPLQPITVELPENQQMSKLITELAAECRIATERSQLLVSTHAPEFANTLKAKELWIISKNEAGITRAIKAADMPGIELICMMVFCLVNYGPGDSSTMLQ